MNLPRSLSSAPMKVGIVVPYSWSFWGAVLEHAELQADALRRLGIETRSIMGHDPPGAFTNVLHPRHGRHGRPPAEVLPVGRSVMVPANGSLPNIVLSPSSVARIKRILVRERFDLLHLHEPMTPAICTAALAFARCPVVASDIDGYREVMTREAGVSFPAGDEQALTAAVAGLLDDEQRRAALGEGARRVAVERYSWDDIGRRLVEIYEQAARAA